MYFKNNGMFSTQKKKSPTEIRTADRPARSLVAIPKPLHEYCFLYMPNSSPLDQGLISVRVLLSHSDTSHSVGLLWTSDRPVAETFDNTQHSQETDIHAAAEFEPAIPSKRAAADRAATGNGCY